MAKLHTKLPLPLRRRPQLRAEPKHGVQAAIGIQREILRADIRLADHRIAFIQQPHNIPLELVGGGNSRLHQRFQHLRLPRREGLAERLLRRHLEGHLRGVGHVGLAIVDDHARAEDLVPDERALAARGLEALVAGVEELLADGAAGDLLLELVGLERTRRLHPAHDAGEVAGAAGLLLEEVVEGDALRQGLAVGDLRLARLAGDPVFAAHALDVDVEVELAHARDDGLGGLGVDVDAEGGVFALEAGHGFGEVGQVFVVLGLDGEGDDGLGHEHGGHAVAERAVREGVARGAVDAEDGADLARADLGHVFHFVAVHAHDARDFDLLIGARVEDVGGAAEGALVYADVGQLAEVGLFELEGEADEGEGVVGDELDGGFVAAAVEGEVFDFGGVGQVVAHAVEHGLNGFVGERRAHEDGGKFEGDGGATDCGFDLLCCWGSFVEVYFRDLVVYVGEGFNEHLPSLESQWFNIRRDLVGFRDGLAFETLVVYRFHSNQVDYPFEGVFTSDWYLHSGCSKPEFVVDLINGLERIGPHAVHLVDEGYSRDVVSSHLPVHCNGLRLHAGDSAQDHDCSI